MPPVRFRIEARGIVQGVGFRPFVYNLANRLHLAGNVLNNKLGVTIEIEGTKEGCEKFLKTLKTDAPPLSRISDIKTESLKPVGDAVFKIMHSRDEGADIALIPPDNDVCANCICELLDKNDRRYRYPFINCTDCGPRYSIIGGTPYDRPKTSMKNFNMCEKCQSEYDDPSNRRFHAQPNACPVCGPKVKLLDCDGKMIGAADPVADTAAYIKQGLIVAIKGIGGYQIACDAKNEEAVKNLRDRKLRKEKPFAVMSRDVEAIRQYADVNKQEKKLLNSREKPILLLKKRAGGVLLADSVAPGLNEYGVFLPYTPIHHLLFSGEDAPAVLVMTSGNVTDEPIVFEDSELLDRLGGIADYFLVNNRSIVWRCDDSVIRTHKGKAALLRRSRGWVPAPVFIEKKAPPILALGGDLKSVFSLASGNTVFPGPHIGDLERAEAFDSFKKSIRHFKKIFGIEPERVVVDKHPRYFSSNYGRSLGLPVTEVQHHHAHIASVMLENRLKGDVIGLSLDGTGYGDDGTIWGGEVLLCGYGEYQRKFHFPALKLPGGDKAVQEPWRIASALLHKYYGENLFDTHPKFVEEIGEEKIRNVIMMLESDTNCPAATSAGRLFDAVASIMLVSHFNSYDGQAPILLEAYADTSVYKDMPFLIESDGSIDFESLITGLVIYAGRGGGEEGAAIFHNTVASALTECCLRIKKESGVSNVCLGGGTFQNVFLMNRLLPMLEKDGFTVYLPNQLPINDGGLSVGQLAVALSGI